jgi:hypothetical protein
VSLPGLWRRPPVQPSLLTASAPPRWEQRGWLLVGSFVTLFLLVVLLAPWPRSDFDAYHRAAVRVGHGENPYQLDELGIHGTFRYPPFFAYLMMPLGELKIAWAGRIWVAVVLLNVAGSLLAALRLVQGPPPWPAGTGAVALTTLLACSMYCCHNLFQCQVAMAMTLCCLGWAACRRAGYSLAGGTLLALGCALKLAPVVLLPYLVLRGDWRGLAGAAMAGALIVLTPAPWVGVEGAVELHRDWLRHAEKTQVPVQNYRVGNQGLMGQIARLPHISNGKVCYSEANLAVLTKNFPLIVAGLGALLYGCLAWGLLGRPRLSGAAADRRDNLHLTVLLIFMTLAHPCAWRCNFAPLLLPCVMLARHHRERRPGFRLSYAALVLLTVTWAWSLLLGAVDLAAHWDRLTGWPAALKVLKGDDPDPGWTLALWLVQGAHFWTALFVGGACLWLFRARSSDAPIADASATAA